MAEKLKNPSPRNLDIYRLVVARGLKQAEVAVLFAVTPVRIFQIVRRVRRWVDESIGGWLFPRRDDLRFYVALEIAQIRVHELDDQPQSVLFTAPGWIYRREPTSPSQTVASHDGKQAASLSTAPLNLLPKPAEDAIDATPSAASHFAPSHFNDLAHRLAELLIVWQKSRKGSPALKWSSFAAG